VEDEAALPLLAALGVRAAQGFRFSHPVPSAVLERTRETWRSWAYRTS
jgi:EAL domain-containing protein (putative c-di-GMP-specific phosphodiesterase class I)